MFDRAAVLYSTVANKDKQSFDIDSSIYFFKYYHRLQEHEHVTIYDRHVALTLVSNRYLPKSF